MKRILSIFAILAVLTISAGQAGATPEFISGITLSKATVEQGEGFTINFTLTEFTFSSVDVLIGESSNIREYELGPKESGTYTVVWNGKDNSGNPLPVGPNWVTITAYPNELTDYDPFQKVSPSSSSRPWDVALAGKALYAVDYNNNKVAKFSSNSWTDLSFENLNKPQGISALVVGSGTAVCVADTGNNCIKALLISGTNPPLTASYGSAGSGEKQFSAPTDVALGNGKIYVADSGNNRIQILKLTTSGIPSIAPDGKWEGFSKPLSVALDSEGNVYVADTNRVQKFSPAGALLKTFDTKGGNPLSIAIGPEDKVCISTDKSNIIMYDKSGALLLNAPSNAANYNSFKPVTARGLAVDSDGYIWAAHPADSLTPTAEANPGVFWYQPLAVGRIESAEFTVVAAAPAPSEEDTTEPSGGDPEPGDDDTTEPPDQDSPDPGSNDPANPGDTSEPGEDNDTGSNSTPPSNDEPDDSTGSQEGNTDPADNPGQDDTAEPVEAAPDPDSASSGETSPEKKGGSNLLFWIFGAAALLAAGAGILWLVLRPRKQIPPVN